MTALCSCFNLLEAAVDREIDCLVVTDLEMQKGVMFEAAPVTSKQSIATDEIQRTRDVGAGSFAHDQQRMVGQSLADQAEELPREVRRAPFPRACIQIEAVESIPM